MRAAKYKLFLNISSEVFTIRVVTIYIANFSHCVYIASYTKLLKILTIYVTTRMQSFMYKILLIEAIKI